MPISSVVKFHIFKSLVILYSSLMHVCDCYLNSLLLLSYSFEPRFALTHYTVNAEWCPDCFGAILSYILNGSITWLFSGS